ncbi:MAG: hypothetical protein WBV18_13310 [Methyloceanibacter sp.]|jgi:UDP-glucose 6-dehydrogenase|uniref:hypothetical protein n=1 Tax=Methyloceanibacter sp. TaxID=1965321 RepID=UPI003C3C90CE
MNVLTEIDDSPGFAVVPLVYTRTRPGDARIADVVELIRKVGGRKVGFLGLACVQCADGSRERPIVEVMSRLADQGYEVAAFDPAIHTLTDRLLLGRAGMLFASAEPVINWCQTLVVTYHTSELQRQIAARQGRCMLIDLVDLFAEQPPIATLTTSLTCCRRSTKHH